MVSPDEARLKMASFKGVSFAYFDYSTESGRRTAEHTYPFRDDAYVEDMGLAPDKFAISAFLLGDDHDLKADALEAVLRKTGSGELVHPRHGALTVQLQTYTRSESTEAGGMTRFSLNFIKTGPARYPTAAKNVQATALSLLNNSRASMLTYAINTALSLYERLRDASWLSNQLGMLATALTPFTFVLPNPTTNSSTSSSGLSGGAVSPATLASTLLTTLNALAIVPTAPADAVSGGWLVQSTNLDSATIKYAYPRLLNAATALLQSIPVDPAAKPIGMDALTNVPASLYLLPAMAAMELATQAASIAALLIYDTAEAALIARDQAHAILDACLPLIPLITAGVTPVDIYDQLRALRALIADTINQQALTLPKIRQAVIGYYQPALVLSQRIYRDATRAPDLIQRNNIIHPLFVSGALEYAQ